MGFVPPMQTKKRTRPRGAGKKAEGRGDTTIFLNQYQDSARETDQNHSGGLGGLAFPLLGLFGEVGTLLSALKKKQRDKDSFVGYSEAVIEEFGDVLWYFANIASRAGLNLSVLAQLVFRDLADWDQVEVHHFGTFGDIQSRRDPAGSANSPEFEAAVIALAGKTGLLLNDFSVGRIANNRDALSAHLVEIFRALIRAADVADVDLEVAASRNLEKINSRWPTTRSYSCLFDEGFRPSEQLPRKIDTEIIEEEIRGKLQVVQRLRGVKLGSSLTDNKLASDDYRFQCLMACTVAA